MSIERGNQPQQSSGYDRPIFGDRPPRGRTGRAGRDGYTGRKGHTGNTGNTGRTGHSGPHAPALPKRKMSLNTKMFLFILVVFVALGSVAYMALRPKEDRYVLDTFQYTTVGTRDFRNIVHTSGRVVPTSITVITAPTDATVLEVHGAAGEDVASGTVLARLASDGLEADLEAAQREYDIAVIEVDQARLQHAQEISNARSEVAKARAELEQAQANLPMIEELYALGGVSRKELEDAQAAVATSLAALERAEENLALAERKAELAVKRAEQQEITARGKVEELTSVLNRLNVVAPVSARVLETKVSPGDSVKSQEALFRLADVRTQRVETIVSPDQAAAIKPGAPAIIRTGGAEYPAVVAHVAPLAVAAESGTQVPVALSIAEEVAEQFLPNAPVTVEIELGVLAQRPYLHRGPFFASGNASFVYVLNDDHTVAERRDVRYGQIDGEFVEILAGLEPGDQVIYSSYTAFRSYRTIDLMPEGGRKYEPGR